MAVTPLRMGAEAVSATTTPTTTTPEREWIQYGGRRFSCTPEMARIFLAHARAVIESGDDELVPLRHSGGIELLLITRATPYSLLDPTEMD